MNVSPLLFDPDWQKPTKNRYTFTWFQCNLDTSVPGISWVRVLGFPLRRKWDMPVHIQVVMNCI